MWDSDVAFHAYYPFNVTLATKIQTPGQTTKDMGKKMSFQIIL